MRSFEEIPDIAERIKRSKMELQESGFYWAPEWDSQSCCDQDYVNNFKKGWESLQTEVDELQKRVEELTVGCGLQRDHIKGLEAELKKAWTTVDQEGHKNHELVMLLKFVKEHFEMNGLDKAMPRVYEKLEQALKGGSDEIQNR